MRRMGPYDVITLIIPTRNRAHTLKLVASSYFEQDGINEIIFVSDAGEDETPELIAQIAKNYPGVSTKFIRNEVRLGAAGARNVGVVAATNENIIFCDDDEYLQPGYAMTCLRKLEAYDAGAVSGRNVYMLENETREEALARFGLGLRKAKPFNYLLGQCINGARYDGDISLPYTHAIILTKRAYLLAEPFDSYYSKGNGYREESDYQMRLFLKGKPIYVTNEAHSVHLPPSKVRTGGQRTQLWRRLYWSIFYTNYFYKKYYAAYAPKVGLKAPRQVAVAAFAVYALYRETLWPILHPAAMSFLRWRRSVAA
jgi:glycosyltransferase involved in cell wall biosynthesis